MRDFFEHSNSNLTETHSDVWSDIARDIHAKPPKIMEAGYYNQDRANANEVLFTLGGMMLALTLADKLNFAKTSAYIAFAVGGALFGCGAFEGLKAYYKDDPYR